MWRMDIRAPINFILDYYRRPSAWLGIGVTALIMIYIGGLPMFWFHSILLGEGGPAISPALHWFIDSTAGLALAPILFVLLPYATRFATAAPGAIASYRFALFGGGLFALFTGPGPWLHNTFVGRGTWLADQVTRLWGDDRSLPPFVEVPIAMSMALQVAFGLPVYVALMWLVFHILRAIEARERSLR